MAKAKKATKVRKVWRDAKTGKILSAAAAARRDPATVVHETVKKK